MYTVLHYTGYENPAGGIVSVIRALAATGRFRVLHGVSPTYVSGVEPPDTLWRGPAIDGESIGLRSAWRARAVARAVRAWLEGGADRIFHAHSRAGLLVALWLERWGERRVVVSVHCYGKQRWFYRHAAEQLRGRVFWLTPEMRIYYRLGGSGWQQCIPGGVSDRCFGVTRPAPQAGRLRLGGAGAVVRWKRWELILEAMAALPKELRTQVSFEHIGAPDNSSDSRAYAGGLVRLTEKLGLGDCVLWRGPESSTERLLASIDVVVVPSHDEPYSMVIQEAWAAGTPVIAADSGGPHDVVRERANGWFFADGDSASLAKVITERLVSGDWTGVDRSQLKRGARRAAEAAEQWEKVYENLTGATEAPSAGSTGDAQS